MRQTRHRESVGGLRDDRDRVGVRHHEWSGVRSQTHGRRHHFTDHRPPSRRLCGNVLPSGSDGEIQLRGVTITPGYWRRDDLTEEAFTPDGWLRTGDLGNVDADGFLHITRRIKEIVIRGGENIAQSRSRTSPTDILR